MASPARLYYFYIEPIVLHSKKQHAVFLMDNDFTVGKHNPYIINTNTFTHIDLQIPVDSIKDYRDLQAERRRMLSFYRGWTVHEADDPISDVDKERIIKLRQQLDEIEISWFKKASAFLAWKRRRQLVAMWTRN
jgi:hypothetical protein